MLDIEAYAFLQQFAAYTLEPSKTSLAWQRYMNTLETRRYMLSKVC